MVVTVQVSCGLSSANTNTKDSFAREVGGLTHKESACISQATDMGS